MQASEPPLILVLHIGGVAVANNNQGERVLSLAYILGQVKM
ncbi:hypothetical protein SDC9_56165 [bioreactor metagenome]|uniref:Uncharacterized protein n=1 Tax=bioreactor metagenome TaxID=1076179 RepID=A0A644X136_9ZZZZ